MDGSIEPERANSLNDFIEGSFVLLVRVVLVEHKLADRDVEHLESARLQPLGLRSEMTDRSRLLADLRRRALEKLGHQSSSRSPRSIVSMSTINPLRSPGRMLCG